MTNYDKLRAVEISGVRLFEHLSLADMKYLLTNIRCIDCPYYGECEDDNCKGIIDWLKEEAK